MQWGTVVELETNAQMVKVSRQYQAVTCWPRSAADA